MSNLGAEKRREGLGNTLQLLKSSSITLCSVFISGVPRQQGVPLSHVLSLSDPATKQFPLSLSPHHVFYLNSDPAMKQFLLYLDESNALGKKFIIQDIDDTHVFVIAELVNVLQERVGELMDQNAFSLTQK